MKPSVGRIVHAYVADTTQNNGADVAPAVITRVWNDTLVNVRILLDGDAIAWRTSVQLHDERPEGEAVNHSVWWPSRVDG